MWIHTQILDGKPKILHFSYFTPEDTEHRINIIIDKTPFVCFQTKLVTLCIHTSSFHITKKVLLIAMVL